MSGAPEARRGGAAAGEPQPAARPAGRFGPALRLAGAALSLIVCAALLVYGSGRGFDLTDEVFYLVWTRDPRAYALVYQPFGYLLHPLFALVGGDLQAYRLAGFAIAAGAGALLGAALAPPARSRVPFALYGAAAALTIFFPWIVTPSYNSAANVGAMLILAGLVAADGGDARRAGLAALAGGAGLCLAAFAKPPLFAIAVAAMSAAALVSRRRQAVAAMAAALLIGALLVSLLLPPSEWPGLVARMSRSQHALALPNTPLRLPAKALRDWAAVPPELSAAALAAAASLAFRRQRWAGWAGGLAMLLGLSYARDMAVDLGDGDMPDFVGLSLAIVAAGYAGLLGEQAKPARARALLLLAAPLAVALGTFNNQWFQLNFSLAFPLLAFCLLAASDRLRWRASLAQSVAVLAPPAILLLAALHPYSLPASIFDQQLPVAPPLAGGTIRVDAETADFLAGARGLARGAVLLDLSGTGPGVAAVLGGRPPALAWLNPATPTWPDVAWSRLDAQARARAWFVGPVWPQFRGSAPARWLAGRQALYCPTDLPPMTFWGEERQLQLWRPCRSAPP